MLSISRIKTGVKVANWKEAIKAAGEILVEVGSSTKDYVNAMISSVEELGPYIVITPQVALAHARPSDAVLQADMSLVVLEEAVEFGSEANDPVKLVFAFCATDNDSHLEQLGKLAANLNPETINQLAGVSNAEEAVAILGGS
ncbi:MAG: PTS sugar transporter subunit IIA [Turicibacter sp.]|nr:PTS sugar transporter subunit IIA [Turicibacter sp.]